MQEANNEDGGGGGGGFDDSDAAAMMMMRVDDEEEHMALLNALQTAGGFQDLSSLLEKMSMMGIDHNDTESLRTLLHALIEQEQERMRPEEHYLTIAQNGIILEATKTVTGFPPDALLMTSAYDAVYEEDLPGFLAVKTHFWDKGLPDAEVYLRRRTFEGDWIWLKTKAVSYVDQPIPGIILLEQCVEDEYVAHSINRITRITSILVQAVEAAQVASLPSGGAQMAAGENNNNSQNNSIGRQMQDSRGGAASSDAAAYQTMIQQSANFDDGQIINSTVRQIMNDAENSANPLEQEIMERIGGKKKEVFDPFSVIEEVREGVRLDLGMTRLSTTEAKMIALVLSGQLHAEELARLVYHALKNGEELGGLLDYVAAAKAEGSGNNNPNAIQSTALPMPPISVVNLSYTYLGNQGIELFGRVLCMENSPLRTIDLSFCGLEEAGCLSLARSLAKRKWQTIDPLRGIILSGNHISSSAAFLLGRALSPERYPPDSLGAVTMNGRTDANAVATAENPGHDEAKAKKYFNKRHGLIVLHLSSALVDTNDLEPLLKGIGPNCPVRELSLASNDLGPEGAATFVKFLEKNEQMLGKAVMPYLDRVDLSNNNLGDDGLRKLTAAISKRSSIHLVELRLSNNLIGASGVETMMKQLLQHNLVSLSIDKNSIGDQGCQLVAASLQSMKSLSRLNLGFNQIGSRGVNSLMRSLVACESITFLGLSGNSMKISGAVALAFTLAQHPRLEELSLDNCCLSQAAQCHIVAGIISNRWVPMKKLNGFEVGPPMVALDALQVAAQNLSNEECFRQRKDEQMKTIFQWMKSNRNPSHIANQLNNGGGQQQFNMSNDARGVPSQDPYQRLLDWLVKIPFDEDELVSLRKYFYDSDGGSEDRGSDGYINLKLRGDLLAALESDVADKIRDETEFFIEYAGSVGIDLEKLESCNTKTPWAFLANSFVDFSLSSSSAATGNGEDSPRNRQSYSNSDQTDDSTSEQASTQKKRRVHSSEFRSMDAQPKGGDMDSVDDENQSRGSMSSASRDSTRSLHHSGSEQSSTSQSERQRNLALKPRISMFPKFEQILEEYKIRAHTLFEREEDPEQQEYILTEYAENSLTILRQLRYHCMNSGLDGWRQGGLKKRKILIVDDSKSSRKLVSRAFEKANFTVDTAANGAEGVEKMKQSIYDIAFMDIDMPVMNGFEATKRLREWEDAVRPGARQPICALTAAYVDDFERSELMKFKEAGLDVMESKPYNIPRLFKVVDDVSPMFSDLSISVIQQERGGGM